MGLVELGNLTMGLGLLAAIIAVAALAWGDRLGEKQGESVTNMGYLATFGVLGSVTISSLILISAFFQQDFRFQYVAENHSTDVSNLAWLYQLSGIWAGREGSLLFWEWLLAMFVAYVAWRSLQKTDRLTNVALAVANAVQVFFLVALFIQTNNPFKISPADWLGPNGELLISAAMNPLLQHWAMILHPPTLFVGYAGLAIPFAYAVAALVTGDASSTWVKQVDRITVFSWLFLGIGIGLGAIWAYVVLGWGGYWAWDPVENASLLPWLTGVGLLHSFTVYRKRNGFKAWSIMLASVTYVLVLLGTWITRSGIVQSVHAFQEDPWSMWWFLSMMMAVLFIPAAVLMMKKETFASDDEFESLVSKEGSYYFNNVLMLVASILVAYWTVSSALPSWLPGGGQSFGPATYDAVARPVGILYVFIMAVCPILSWGKTDGQTFMKRAGVPLIGAAGLGAALLAIWWTELWPNYLVKNSGANPLTNWEHGWEAIIGLLVGAFAISVPLYLFYSGAKKRSAAKGENFATALFNIFAKARQQSGGYLTHLGIGIILVGLIGSAMFVQDVKQSFPDQPGASFEVDEFTFTYQGIREEQRTNGDVNTLADFQVKKNGQAAGVLSPGILFHARQNQTTRNVDIIYEPLRDVFFIFEGTDEAGNIAVNVLINPLISWVWVGFVLLIAGTSIAMWPKKAAA